MVGGYLVTFGSNPISTGDHNTLIAALFSLLAAFCWGSSTVLGKQALIFLPFSVVTALRLIIHNDYWSIHYYLFRLEDNL